MLNKPRHSFLPVVFPAFLSSVTWHGGAIEWAIGNPHLLLLHVLATPNVKAMWSKSSSGVGKSQRDLRNPGSPIRTVVMFIASLWERATLQSVRAWPFIGNKTVNVAKILGKSDWWATWVATGSCCKHMCCQGWSSCVASVQTHESTWPKLLPRFHSCCISHQTEQKWAAANHCCNIKSSDSDQQSQTVFFFRLYCQPDSINELSLLQGICVRNAKPKVMQCIRTIIMWQQGRFMKGLAGLHLFGHTVLGLV